MNKCQNRVPPKWQHQLTCTAGFQERLPSDDRGTRRFIACTHTPLVEVYDRHGCRIDVRTLDGTPLTLAQAVGFASGLSSQRGPGGVSHPEVYVDGYCVWGQPFFDFDLCHLRKEAHSYRGAARLWTRAASPYYGLLPYVVRRGCHYAEDEREVYYRTYPHARPAA